MLDARPTVAPEYADEEIYVPTIEHAPKTTNPLLRELIGEGPVVQWILSDFLAQGSLVALAGMPGAGKSYLCYTLGFALASGVPVLGYEPDRPYRVLYFDQENAHPDRIQYERWAWNGLGCPSLDLLCKNFWGSPFTLGGSQWYTAAKAAVDYHKPEIIFIDTATPACGIEDENNNAEATRVIEHIRALQNAVSPTATCIVIKHAKVRADDAGVGIYTLRGAKAWEGAVDNVIFHVRGEGRPRKDGLNNTKLQPAKTRAFGLRDPITIEPRWLEDRSGIVLDRWKSEG
jgi:hypothetical protein